MNDASRLKDGQAQYSALLTPAGLLCRRSAGASRNENNILLVVTRATRTRTTLRSWPMAGKMPNVRITDDSASYSHCVQVAGGWDAQS